MDIWKEESVASFQISFQCVETNFRRDFWPSRSKKWSKLVNIHLDGKSGLFPLQYLFTQSKSISARLICRCLQEQWECSKALGSTLPDCSWFDPEIADSRLGPITSQRGVNVDAVMAKRNLRPEELTEK